MGIIIMAWGLGVDEDGADYELFYSKNLSGYFLIFVE
jgi:hypothetical protein